MDIGPTELPIQAILPAERVRRVEESPDPRQNPQRRQSDGEPRDADEHEAPHDSVDLSESYRTTHPEHLDPVEIQDLQPDGDADRSFHVDIEA